MKPIWATLAALLLASSLALPARADFEYTETLQVTGGALVGMMKVVGVFSRGDAKKQEQQAMQPTSTTHYVKGGKLRSDNADGTSQVIDLDGKRVISIDNNNKTYGVATFDQIHDAMVQAMQVAQQEQQADAAQHPEVQNAQLNITPTIKVTPGAGNRTILGQSTNETKVEMDITMQATGPNQTQQGQPNSATMTTSMDTFVAPGVAGYQEFSRFYRRMAQEVSWMKLPSNIHVTDPRVSQNMSELQQNSDALKGFPMLSYVNMGMAPVGQTNGSPAPAQNQNATPPSQTNSSSSDSSNSSGSFPTSASAALTKGLGSIFGKKKPQSSNQGNTDQANGSSQAAAPPQNPNSNPNDLIEVTTQVTKFSDSSLDASLFDVPAGYTQIQVDPAMVMAGHTQTQQAPRSK